MLAMFFPAMCAYGAFDIIRGFYTGDLSYITVGIVIALIGVNLSIISPPNLLVLLISGIATIFVSDWHYSIGAGIAIIAIYTAYCLITTMLERQQR